MMNFAFEMMNFVLKIMNFALNMMSFVALPVDVALDYGLQVRLFI